MELDYKRFQKTLAEVSKDDNGSSLIENEKEVFDFDEITEVLAKQYRAGKPQCSCDALHIKDEEHIYLIEFKNARSSHVPKKSLKLKAYDSIMTLQCVFCPEISLNEIKEKVYFIFVYNNECNELELKNEEFDKLKNKLKKLTSGNQPILFGLEIYKDMFYKDVFTIDKEQFNNSMCHAIFE